MSEIIKLRAVKQLILLVDIDIKTDDVVNTYHFTSFHHHDRYPSDIKIISTTQIRVVYEDFSSRVLTIIDCAEGMHFIDEDKCIYQISCDKNKPYNAIVRSKYTSVIGYNLSVRNALIYDNKLFAVNYSARSAYNVLLMVTSPHKQPKFVINKLCRAGTTNAQLMIIGREMFLPHPVKQNMRILRLYTLIVVSGFSLLCGVDRAMCIYRSNSGSDYMPVETDFGHVVAKTTGAVTTILLPTELLKLMDISTGVVESPCPVTVVDPNNIPTDILNTANAKFQLVDKSIDGITTKITYKSDYDKITFLYFTCNISGQLILTGVADY